MENQRVDWLRSPPYLSFDNTVKGFTLAVDNHVANVVPQRMYSQSDYRMTIFTAVDKCIVVEPLLLRKVLTPTKKQEILQSALSCGVCSVFFPHQHRGLRTAQNNKDKYSQTY